MIDFCHAKMSPWKGKKMIKGKCIAIITAAGNGSRMETNICKQFLDLKQKPILAHTIEKFESCDIIDEVVLGIKEDYRQHVEQNIIKKYGYKKIRAITQGGTTRQDTVHKALEELPGDCDIVLIHDGVRPFISVEDIEKVVEVTTQKNAAVLAVPVKETIKQIEDGAVKATLDRSKLYTIQTPQCFKPDILLRAYEKAIKENIVSTDDAALVECLGEKVYIVEGSYKNIKITTPEDMVYARHLIEESLAGGRWQQ